MDSVKTWKGIEEMAKTWREQRQRRTETARAKATEVALADYEHAWVCTDVDGEEGTYYPPEEAIANGHAWAFAIERRSYPVPDADGIIEHMCEELHDAAHEHLDVAALQAALDAWHAAQDQNGAGFTVDTTRVVILRAEAVPS